MTKSTNKNLLVLIISLILASPVCVSASSMSFDVSDDKVYVGDSIIINVIIDSEGKNINAVDGKVSLDYSSKAIELKDLSVAGSPFTLWPRKPSLSQDGKSISFVGGAPGFVNTKDILAFRMVVEFKKEGKVSIKPSELSIFLSDGKGTKDDVSTKSLIINVLPKPKDIVSKNEWSAVVKDDNVAPEPFTIEEGRSDSLYDGQQFISFNAVDNQSGIAYYEVKEGDLMPVRSGGTYVLQEQDKRNKIEVTAFDFAHNFRVETYVPEQKNSLFVSIISAIMIVLIGLFIKRKWLD